jgi:oligopeptide transport system permease protein
MIKIIRALGRAILTLFFISAANFFLMKLIPGGPFDTDKKVPPEVLRALEAKFRLDLPWWDQYFEYMKGILLHWDWGPSLKFLGQNVSEIIMDGLPVSIELGCYALGVALVLGIISGTLAAAYRGTWIDRVSMGVAVLGISLPSFLVGALAIVFFAQKLGILPAAMWDSPAHKVLPTLVLGIRPAALIARLTRSSVLETLQMDFIRTARAKGLSRTKVLFVHALRNSLLPVLSLLGPLAATVLTGSFVIEYMFSVPGLATHFIQAVNNRDYPLLMGATLLYAAMLVFLNFCTEALSVSVDPRLRRAA